MWVCMSYASVGVGIVAGVRANVAMSASVSVNLCVDPGLDTNF